MGTKIIRTAVVQAGSILFNRDACLDIVHTLAAKAAAEKARLVLFPEAFIPGYPRGLTFGTSVGHRTAEGRSLWQKYWDNSLRIGDPSCDRLCSIAEKNNIYLVTGIIEKASLAKTLYCTILYISPQGEILHKHRKLKPTAAERVVWGEGDGRGLKVVQTGAGKIGGLICWENYMPFARMALYEQGVEIYLAPTADARKSWQATLQHIASEGRCFVLGCNQFVTRSMVPDYVLALEEFQDGEDILCRGGSAIVDPYGQYLAGPIWDQEGILIADLDLAEITRAKFDFDVTGHYSRPDVFKFEVNQQIDE
jgi:nitrilase